MVATTLAMSVPVAGSSTKTLASSAATSFATPVSGITIDFPAVLSDVAPVSLTDVAIATNAASM
jgi:hypothetical protein